MTIMIIIIVTLIIVIVIIIIIIVIIIIIITVKCRSRSGTLTVIQTDLPVTLYNGQKPLTNIRKRSTLDAVWVLC